MGELAAGPLTLSDLDANPVATVADPGVDPAVGPGVGRMAPDFTLQTLDGGTFRLSEQRGKPVVLNFWATWCGPCQNELPAVQKAAAHFGDDVVFVGVDQGEKAEVVQSFVDKLGLTFTIPMDADGAVGYDYNVQGLPDHIFHRPQWCSQEPVDGRNEQRHVGREYRTNPMSGQTSRKGRASRKRSPRS